MTAGRWIGFVVAVAGIAGSAVAAVNYLVDPYGFRDEQGRYLDIVYQDSPEIVKTRFGVSDYDLAMAGSSRFFRFEPKWLDSVSGRSTVNLAVAGASLSLNMLLLEKIKSRGKQFVCGFDCFALNEWRESYREEQTKQQRFEEVFSQSVAYDVASIQLLNLSTLTQSARTLYRYARGKPTDFLITVWENERAPMREDLMEVSFQPDAQKKFSRFTSYSAERIKQFAALAGRQDIFVICPKYFRWYDHFERSDVAEQYYRAIETLVQHSRGPVWSFYGRSEVTRDSTNFDGNGWHFKPRIGKRMFQQIFGDPETPRSTDFGVLLTKATIGTYIDSLRRHEQF